MEMKKKASKLPEPIVTDADRLSAIPPDVLEKLHTTIRSGKWMIAAIRVEDESLRLELITSNFPKIDIDPACSLFIENANIIKNQ